MNMTKLREFIKKIGRRGGKKSVKVRFEKKTPEEISEMMSKIRLTKKDEEELEEMADATLAALRSIKE